MLEPQAARFWHAALQSGLIDATGLEACWQAIPPEKRTPDAIDRRLARQTVRAGHLTLWQAQQVLKGRSIGFRIDKYLLLDHIGHGGMGRVYLAQDTRLGRRVALKVLSPERMNNPRALARFQREAKVGAQLQHENLVRIYDEGESAGIRYLVMEFIEGKTAGHIISERGPMPPAAAARLARQVALGLDHARQKGLIHRDVNPWNILVTNEGVAKLTDLGLAIDLADNDAAVTRDGATVGTFDYISPEQARHSRSVDTRSDIYSLGCTLYHLLAGRVPFPMPSLPEKLYAHQTAQPEPLEKVVPAIPPGLSAVVQKMMAKAPEDRFHDPGALAQALEPFASSSSVTVVAAAAAAVAVKAGSPLHEPRVGAGDGSSASPTTEQSASELAPPAKLRDSSTEFQAPWGALDLGPELPLAEKKATPKPSHKDAMVPKGLRANLLAVAGALVVIAGTLAMRHFSMRVEPEAAAVPSTSSGPVKNSQSPDDGLANSADAASIVVSWPDGSEKKFLGSNDFDALREAIQAAGSSGASVVLRNRKPLVIDAKQPITCPGGNVVIRAGKNEQPVLAVTVAGEHPFLVAKSDTVLKLARVTFQVTYASHLAKTPPPLIQAGSDITLDRCAFTTTSQSGGGPAVLVEGQDVAVTNCFFDGFSPSISLISYAGSLAHLSHSILSQESGDPRSGWAISVRRGAGGGGTPRPNSKQNRDRVLTIDHCTICGQGLLDVVDFGVADSPLSVDINDSAVRAGALLMWRGDAKGFPKGIAWSGERNRYEVGGAGWVVAPPVGDSSIADALPGSPTDLDSWTKAVTAESGTEVETLRFAPGASGPPPRQAKDFALEGHTDTPVGADPAHVGPQSQK
jgi:serine/threonine protein kinase